MIRINRQKQRPENNYKQKWFDNLGNIRDGLLIAISCIYGFGYLVWAIVAYNNELGYLPVLDTQYFLAGIPPCIVIILIVLSIYTLKLVFFQWWPIWIKKLKLKTQYYIQQTISITIIFLSTATAVQGFLYYPKYLMWYPLCILLLAYFLLQPDKAEVFRHFPHASDMIIIQKYLQLYVLPVLLGIAVIYIYINVIFFKIPQEFGGAKPLHARLDLISSKLSIVTKEQFTDLNKSNINDSVVHSKLLKVHFYNKDFLLIEDTGNQNNQKIEIPRDAVKTIYWHKI